MHRIPSSLRIRLSRAGSLHPTITGPSTPRQLRAPASPRHRPFSSTAVRAEILDLSALPDRTIPKYEDKPDTHLLTLNWPRPPQNVLLIPKQCAPRVTLAAVAFAKYLHANYPGLNLVLEPRVADEIHGSLPFPVYSSPRGGAACRLPAKVDVVTTLGGDGTILRAASLFGLQDSVPPILAFSMGTLGFLGEWKFEEYKRAWREVYMSGSGVSVEDLQGPHTRVAASGRGTPGAAPRVISVAAPAPAPAPAAAAAADGQPDGWDATRGQSMGPHRASKMLLRHRLKVGLYDSAGKNLNRMLMPSPHDDADPCLPPGAAAHPTLHSELKPQSGPPGEPDDEPPPDSIHVINELLIHRGPHPHLVIMDIFLNGHFLTEAVADGIIVSTPTGSTAYSLSAGGSIVHPLVKSVLITPICPRSLSFRPLVVPLNTRVSLRLSKKNRGRDLEVSVDGGRRAGVSTGMEIRVEGEPIVEAEGGGWTGGVPCVIRVPPRDAEGGEDDDGWVGGLNGLLKFNYPFGETPGGA